MAPFIISDNNLVIIWIPMWIVYGFQFTANIRLNMEDTEDRRLSSIDTVAWRLGFTELKPCQLNLSY